MCRSDALSMSLPARRSTRPEIFTFDRVPEEPAPLHCARPRRRRVARVLYPSTNRRYLPRAERSPAKRWLVALCLVVLLQIYAEDDVMAEGASEAREVLPFASAEESARRLTSPRAEEEEQQRENSSPARSLHNLCSWWSTACPARTSASPSTSTSPSESARWEREARKQSVRNGGYVVALLYPVYHTLGSEQ